MKLLLLSLLLSSCSTSYRSPEDELKRLKVPVADDAPPHYRCEPSSSTMVHCIDQHYQPWVCTTAEDKHATCHVQW